MERDLRPALVLSAWTVLVWTTRIRNIWTDDALSTAGQVWRTALAVAFTAFAAATVVVWWRVRSAGWRPSWASALVRSFAVWTIVVWVLRGAQIALADHSVGFVVVHSALAAVSIVLAVRADRAMQRTARPEPAST